MGKTGSWIKTISIAIMSIALALASKTPVVAADLGLPAMILINLMPTETTQQTEVPTPTPTSTTPTETAPLDVAATAAGGYIVFAQSPTHLDPEARPWPEAKLQAMVEIYDGVILNTYSGEGGFGSAELWAEAFGVSRDNPIVVIYVDGDKAGAPARAAWKGTTPVVTHYTLRTAVRSQTAKLVTHELAHIWDHAHDWALGAEMVTVVENPTGYPTAKARDEGAMEDFAESVTAALWEGYAVNTNWTDDFSDRPDGDWTLDRYDYVVQLFGRP